MHEEEVLGKAYDSRLLRRLVTYLRPYKKAVAVAFVLILLESVLEIAFPWLLKIAIDSYIAVNNMSGLAYISAVFIRRPVRHTFFRIPARRSCTTCEWRSSDTSRSYRHPSTTRIPLGG